MSLMQTISALRSFLLAVLPPGTEVVLAQDNRVPMPEGPNFVTMTELMRPRLSTNVVSYYDGFPSGPQLRHALQPTRVEVQLDIHGPESSENLQIITTLFRDEYGAEKFKASGFDVEPLFCSEPRQVPFLNDQQQVDKRWAVDVAMQANPVVTTGQEFASVVSPDIGELVSNINNVDAAYPPG